MPQLKLGVIGQTGKENEHRLPIHPDHFDRIDADLRATIYVERGYGEHFGVSDAQLSEPIVSVPTQYVKKPLLRGSE